LVNITRIHTRIIPDPVLRQTAQPVGAVDKKVALFMDYMLESAAPHQ